MVGELRTVAAFSNFFARAGFEVNVFFFFNRASGKQCFRGADSSTRDITFTPDVYWIKGCSSRANRNDKSSSSFFFFPNTIF